MNLQRLGLFASVMVTALFVSVGYFGPALSADEPAPAKHQPDPARTVTVKLGSYGFEPDRIMSIDQHQPSAKAKIEMRRGLSYRMPYGERLERWHGSKEITLKDGYRVKISAVYMVGKPVADFVRNENGLSINVSYYYDKQLLDFESTTTWHGSQQLKVFTTLRDIPYCGLLSQNGFEILPDSGHHYGRGFRFWVALRDGLKGRGEGTGFEALSKFLKPLNRRNNLMIPIVTIEYKYDTSKAAEQGAAPDTGKPRR